MGKLIAFAGKMRSGKDTSADYYLHSLVPTAGRKVSFAASLYDILYYAQDKCGLPRKKDRRFLQWAGDWGREQDPELWIKTLLNDVNDLKKTFIGDIYVTDARYINEMEALKKNGFIIVKIDASDAVRKQRGATDTAHSSEQDIDKYSDYDFIVNNDTSFSILYYQLQEIYEKI